MTSLHTPSCSECGQTFHGRADKKFCSDQCRTSYHNRIKKSDLSTVSNINRVLKRNRMILLTFNPSGKNRVSRRLLISRGFDFNYFTSIYVNREGRQYFYCYDQGYLAIEKDEYLLVAKRKPH